MSGWLGSFGGPGQAWGPIRRQPRPQGAWGLCPSPVGPRLGLSNRCGAAAPGGHCLSWLGVQAACAPLCPPLAVPAQGGCVSSLPSCLIQQAPPVSHTPTHPSPPPPTHTRARTYTHAHTPRPAGTAATVTPASSCTTAATTRRAGRSTGWVAAAPRPRACACCLCTRGRPAAPAAPGQGCAAQLPPGRQLH